MHSSIKRYTNVLMLSSDLFVFHLQIDTEVCEQTFSWLSKYAKMTRKMNRGHFVFFIIYVQHLHNLREEEKLRNSGYMAGSNNDQS